MQNDEALPAQSHSCLPVTLLHLRTYSQQEAALNCGGAFEYAKDHFDELSA